MIEPAAALDVVPPAFILAFVLIWFFALLYKSIAGRQSETTLLCLAASSIGFAAGQFFGARVFGSELVLGELHVIEASIGAWLVLLLVNRPRL